MRQLKIATQITNRDSQAVEKYLQEISKISMITPEEESTFDAGLEPQPTPQPPESSAANYIVAGVVVAFALGVLAWFSL